MTSTIKVLEPDKQISDDFLMGFDSETGEYIAVRSPNEECPFRVTDKSYWLCVTKALDIFHEYVKNKPDSLYEKVGTWDHVNKKVIWSKYPLENI